MAEFYRRDRAPAMFLSARNFYAKNPVGQLEKIVFNGRRTNGNQKAN
jgi:hypothetical protein